MQKFTVSPSATPIPTRLGITAKLVLRFLADQAQAGRSPHSLRAYRAELAHWVASHPGPLRRVTTDSLRAFLAKRDSRRHAPSQARTRSALASFFAWAYREGAIAGDPMVRIERVRVDPPPPRGIPRAQVEAVLVAIPPERARDQVLFRLIGACGLCAGEALGLRVEDLDLTPGDEHLQVLGKGGRRRRVLLDDPLSIAHLRACLAATAYESGPLFRAEKNGRGGALRYQSAQALWARYCASAGVRASLHQLRHTHASELVDAGVSLATIRKRLGHKNLQTTLRYAELSDAAADAELREWRRRRDPPQNPTPAEPDWDHEASRPTWGPDATDPPRRRIRLHLHMNVQNNNKFLRGRKRAKRYIEEGCLRWYHYRRLDKDGVRFELEVPYRDDDDLKRRIHQLLGDIHATADNWDCCAQCYVQAFDDPDRTWD